MAFDVGAKSKGARPSINITPLVDVVLVLLIIFMVVTPLLTKHFSTRVPEPPIDGAPTDPSNDDAIVVTLDHRGTVRLNSAEVDLQGLRTRLADVFTTRKERIVFFDAADDAPFGDAVDVLDHARAGGAEQIAIATESLMSRP